ncbi:MAG: hypothetical protein AB9919_12360 [Geobacteraceae bacterium]
MKDEGNRTPQRLLIIGCTSFAGLDSFAWPDKIVPNIPDYDLIVVSVPHITEEFLATVQNKFLQDMRKALILFLHSGGKMIVLVSNRISVNRPSQYPDYVSNNDWCPISFDTPSEVGKSIIEKKVMYQSYLQKMVRWSYFLTIPSFCLTSELTDFYGPAFNTEYSVRLEPYLENRYGRVLAGQCCVEVRKEQKRSNEWGNTWSEYPEKPDVTTGQIILLPLIEKMSVEEALATILHEEVGYSAKSPEPDWVKNIEMPFVADLSCQISEAESVITHQKEIITGINTQICEIKSFRRLLYGTGFELEDIVKESLQRLGARVTPAKYAQEEYILEVDGVEYLMEVKGVTKSISLTHLRQLNDYLLKYQEDTGRECKGILFGNPWRILPPSLRGSEETTLFPDNVIKRAEQWGVSLVSSMAYFDAFLKTLENPSLARQILTKMIIANGVAKFD